jgi:hypothetical protein
MHSTFSKKSKLKQRLTLPPDCDVGKCIWNTLSESLNTELTSTYKCVAGKYRYANKGNEKQLAVG